ncbi:hypothetical protein M8C21_022688, partial [Ambrosia artemisiifolia]
MIDFTPPSTALPPTPPLPSSSPTDLAMEHRHSDDEDDEDGPPPGWDNRYQLKEQEEQLAATLAVSSDIQTDDVRQDAPNEEGEPPSQAHHCLPPEVPPTVEEQDSEDDGPPPGWDSKCQPEPKLQETPQSDMNMEDVLQDAHNEESQPTPEVPSDIIVDPEDSEDEGPPPGWDSKCQPEPKLQEISQSDMKMEDVLPDAHNEDGQPTPEVPSVDHENSEDEGPPPGWDAKCQPEPKLQKTLQSDSSDTKTNHVQQDARNENGPQSQSCSSPAPELVPSVEEQDLEDDGPPPGWNSKCQLEPNLQMACPTTPPSDFKIEEDKEHALDKEGSPPGTGHEPNNVKTIEESPQPPSRQQSIHPMKAQITVPKPPMIMNNPEMGQMVCGSCRHLLTYPRGARYVECACCLEENYVLEEHEVGQVVCGNCNVLLMYPYGAPKVRCANCRAETEV